MAGAQMNAADALNFQPVGAHLQDTTIDSATTLHTGSSYTGAATKMLIQAITQNVRMTIDGTTPTTAYGLMSVAFLPPTTSTLVMGPLPSLVSSIFQ